jgi:hypothetical protein
MLTVFYFFIHCFIFSFAVFDRIACNALLATHHLHFFACVASNHIWMLDRWPWLCMFQRIWRAGRRAGASIAYSSRLRLSFVGKRPRQSGESHSLPVGSMKFIWWKLKMSYHTTYPSWDCLAVVCHRFLYSFICAPTTAFTWLSKFYTYNSLVFFLSIQGPLLVQGFIFERGPPIFKTV